MADTRFKKGQLPWNKNLKGIHLSPSTEFKKGRIAPNKIGTTKTCETCLIKYPVKGARRRVFSRFCSRVCRGKYQSTQPGPNAGKRASVETKAKQRQAKLGIRGEAHWNYRGYNNRTARQIAMAQDEYIQWRKAVFERDDYTCQNCENKGCYLHADHIQPWSLFPELRYQVDNGRTLCVPCHRATPTWGAKIKVLESVG